MKEYKVENISYQWEDCSVGFNCPKCRNVLVADSQDGWKRCDCGIEYCLAADLGFREGGDENV